MEDTNNISVIIPCYNYGCFLKEAINSVIKQTKKPSEIIIADDCSNDETQVISKEFIRKYPNLITYFKNKSNLGIVKNFNKAVKLTKFDYICFLGADNRFKKEYLEKTSNVLDKNNKIGIVYTDFELFGFRAEEVYKQFNENYHGKINKQKNSFIINFPNFNNKTKIIQKNNNFIHGSSLYRKKAFEEVGGYKSNKNTPEDQNLFSRIIEKGWNAERVPEPLLEYRQHSQTQANIKLQFETKITNLTKEKEIIKNELLDKITKLTEEKEIILRNLDEIKSLKTYKLWQKYNQVKKLLFKNKP